MPESLTRRGPPPNFAARPGWPASHRNRGRLQIGTPAGIASEYLAGSRRNLQGIKGILISSCHYGQNRSEALPGPNQRDAACVPRVMPQFEEAGRRMSYNAQECLDKAKECERIALQAKDRDAKATLIEIAQQWRELARQKGELERDRSHLP